MPDLSGVFYRTGFVAGKGKHQVERQSPIESPLVLAIRQTNGCLYVSAFQNGATSKSNYWLRDSESEGKGNRGCTWGEHAEFKHDRLWVDSAAPWTSEAIVDAVTGHHSKQSWELSLDQQSLTVNQLFISGEYERDSFARMPSLEAAMDRAGSASEMNVCNALPSPPPVAASPTFDKGVLLGVTGFRQFAKTVLFDAELGGPFSRGLTRVETSHGFEFHRNGKLVQSYSDSLVLEIEPRVGGPLDLSGNSPGVPQEFLDLHFHLKWTGTQSRDLGDVPSKLLTEPWPETRAPRQWYRMEVPAQLVSLTDTLEIHILSSAGKQIGCISGHI